jgi:alanine racemase
MPEHRPAWVEVHLGALSHNLSHLRQHTSGTSVMAVVKANAYGHGLLEVGRFYERSGVEWLAVALMEEGVALRRAGIQIPILVLGGIAPWQIRWGLEHQLDLTVGSIEVLQAVEAAAGALGKTAAVHLKLDTGMERVGIRAEESGPLIEAALRSASVEARGVYSHLACADDPEHPMTSWQIERFLQACQQWEHLGEPLPMRHLANSGGVLHFPESHLDCVRAGIMLYGILPDPQSRSPFPLQPALSRQRFPSAKRFRLEPQSATEPPGLLRRPLTWPRFLWATVMATGEAFPTRPPSCSGSRQFQCGGAFAWTSS